MIPTECKRLAEVDFPIAVVSKHAAREKSIRHGHPSTLHLWWARRPLAACRAVLFAQLVRNSGYWRFHRKRLPELFQACQSNHALRSALDQLLAVSTMNPRSGRYVWPADRAKDDVRTLQKFIEYVYFASNQFLGKVL
jgi:adenine-specific DNA methylase